MTARSNALDGTIDGLFKAEIIHRLGSSKTREAVELATLGRLYWFNHRRLLESIGYFPPVGAWPRPATGASTPSPQPQPARRRP